MSTLGGSIWSTCSIALTCPARSHFHCPLNSERWGQGWDERCRSSKKKRRMRRRARERQEKKGNRFQRVCVLSFCGRSGGSTAKKWFVWGSAWGNWDPREGQTPFPPSPNGVGNHTCTLRRLLVNAVQSCLLYLLYIQQKFCSSIF